MKAVERHQQVFDFFEEISSIPRESGNNKGISDYLVEFAKNNRLSYIQDDFLNVIITKEASEGYENCPTLILQGHMDMVCEKESDVEHDFFKDGLQLEWKEDYIFSNGTTLGGDDGIALAYCLAILIDDNLIHPRLEVVFTTDEEIGMDGAAGLDTSELHGTYMINIDSEEEGTILTSCAGGLTGTSELPLQFEEVEGKLINVAIKGLLGGHSGTEINKNRTNASILLGRLLFDLRKKKYSIVSMNGGLKDNAIPREAFATISVKTEDVYEIINEIKVLSEKYKNELRTSEPELTVTVEQGVEKKSKVLTKECEEQILFMLLQSPNGVQVMSSDIPGLVESSLNLGVFKMEEDKIVFCYSVRSSVSSYKSFLREKLETITTFLGGTFLVKGEYPAWEFKEDSKLRSISTAVFKEQYGYEPKIEAIHAGLECGILSNKLKGIDIISIGPNILDIHTPSEKLSISSTIRVYDYLINLLEAFSKATI